MLIMCLVGVWFLLALFLLRDVGCFGWVGLLRFVFVFGFGLRLCGGVLLFLFVSCLLC